MTTPTLTYEQVAELVRQRLDLENSTFVVDGTVATGELYNHIYLAAEQHYQNLASLRDHLFSTTTTVATVAGTAAYSLSSVLSKLIAVRLVVGDYRYPLRPYDAAWITTSRNQSWGTGIMPRYQLRSVKAGNDFQHELIFDPPPAGVYSLQVEYVPDFAKPAANSLPLPLPFPEWVVLDTAIRLAAKEERDASDLVRERELLTQRIEASWGPADQNWPKGIHDHRANEEDDWGEYGW
jgi:hypothetical protein